MSDTIVRTGDGVPVDSSAHGYDRTALRTWFREDIHWIMRELDGIKMRSGAAARETFNPISPPDEEK